MGQMMSEIADEDANELQPETAIWLEEPEPDNLVLFKKYSVGKVLGKGSTAKVYHGRDLRTGQSVAIKSIDKQRIFNKKLASHVQREIHIMRRLRHPHIVRIHEVLATRTKIYSVMEFAKGGEVMTRLFNCGRFSEDLCRKYFHQLISAVSYCHDHGVFHRDLKPENLLLDENFNLKVTDFGLGAILGPEDGSDVLHTLCGTPTYVAPEVLGKKGYDGGKSDVWSCGVILFVLNAGYLPFNDVNLMALYRKICRARFRCPKWTSPDLRRLLKRIMDPNPNTRITVAGILEDPWFKEGYEAVRLPPAAGADDSQFELKNGYLNAFDLISYSAGWELSGLFNEGGMPRSEMYVSGESAERIIERITAAAGERMVRVVKKGKAGLRLQEGERWNYAVMVEVNRLTEELVAVEVKRSGYGPDFWEEKLKPEVKDLFV